MASSNPKEQVQSVSPPHILVIPLPAQGHLLPLLDLACSALPEQTTITILTTPKNLPIITPYLSLRPNTHPLTLPLPAHPSLDPSVEHVRDLRPRSSTIAALIHALYLLTPQLLSWARSHPSPPTSVLSDFFLGWTLHLASHLSIPRLCFYSSGALVAAVFDHIFPHFPLRPLPSPLPDFPYPHLPSIFRSYDASRGSPEWDFTAASVAANASSHAAVLNTFSALESKYIKYLKESYGHGRVWAVGPIAPALPGSARGGSIDCGSVEELMAWLDSCPGRSVVYACFGSQFRMGESQATALGAALELSGARFVWCPGAAEVPEGIEERVRGRGVIVRGWAPQVEVLGHSAVGAFVTHCGWNSVLEGIVAGVLLLAWPMLADQFINARLLVEEMGVAVLACNGGPDLVPEVEALAKVIADSVDESALGDVKGRAEEMRRAAAEAVAEGGSSSNDLKEMVKELTLGE